jgi:hypothetical protein
VHLFSKEKGKGYWKWEMGNGKREMTNENPSVKVIGISFGNLIFDTAMNYELRMTEMLTHPNYPEDAA